MPFSRLKAKFALPMRLLMSLFKHNSDSFGFYTILCLHNEKIYNARVLTAYKAVTSVRP